MASLGERRLDAALLRGLKGIEGLPESVRLADEAITTHLRQRLGEVLLNEYRRRSGRGEDEVAIRERSAEIMDGAALDAKKAYELFELHMKNRSGEFWETLVPEKREVVAGTGLATATAVTNGGDGGFKRLFSNGSKNASLKVQRFFCTEGCELEGDLAYLAHRDRGHHPVPV